MRRSRLALQRFRENRRDMVRQYVGRHWSEEGTTQPVPVNLLALYTQIVGRALVAKDPRLMLSTFDRSLKADVSAMQAWANKEVERMYLADTLRRVVVDALFSVGVCKVGLATPGDAAVRGWGLGGGQPYAERVDLDDFVFDTNARSFDEVAYIGHRYRIPLDAAKSWLGKKAKSLQASDLREYNEQGDERIIQLGRGSQGDNEDFEDMVDLWEVYLPRHRLVLHLQDDYVSGAEPGRDATELLRQPWVGPYCGPYHVLGFGVVSGNAMPKAPIQDLLDLHLAANRAYRKVMRTVDRVKEITAIRGGAAEDGSRIMNADDGDMVKVDDPQSVNQLIFGGQTLQTVLAAATVFKDVFDFMGGNLSILGGLSPQSKTATQDKMLNENSGRTIADLQESSTKFVSKVGEALCWYWWHDPYKVQRSTYATPGMPTLTTVRQVTPQKRQRGRFDDLGIKVDPYSLRQQTPESRLAALNQVVQQIVIPMAPLLQSQGIMFDANAYLKKVAEYLDAPDLAEVLTVQEPPAQDTAPGGGEGAGMPPNTNRTYTRENVPARTPKGDSQNLVNTLLGVDTGGDPSKNGKPAAA